MKTLDDFSFAQGHQAHPRANHPQAQRLGGLGRPLPDLTDLGEEATSRRTLLGQLLVPAIPVEAHGAGAQQDCRPLRLGQGTSS